MKEIKRYREYSYGVEETVIGAFVKYDDHTSIVAAKDAHIKALEMMSAANVTPGSVVSDLIKEVNLHKTEREELKSQLRRYSMSAGQAGQRKDESNAVRVALGFAADADDVAPCDLVDAIAVLPPEINKSDAPELQEIAAEAERLGIKGAYGAFAVGANWMLSRVKALRAQPQKPVVLPALCVGVVQHGHAVMVPYPGGHWFDKTLVLEALDAANVKWEVKS